MDKKYQVFISSTYNDLIEERSEVMQTLLSNNFMPAAMELFNAANSTQWDTIKKVIDESDYFLVIVAGKYGSIHPEKGISFTRMEYEYAVHTNKPILRFLFKDLNKLPQEKIEKDHKVQKKLDEFRRLLDSNNLCAFYENSSRLAVKVLSGLIQLTKSSPAYGWIHGSELESLAKNHKELEIVDFDNIKEQLEKTVIYKILNLRSVNKTDEGIYMKYIPRIKEKIGITSEYMTIRIHKFDRPVNNFKSYDRTRGAAIEVNSFLPFILGLEDGDKNALSIQPVIKGPSNVYVLNGYAYNGFYRDNLDLAFKVEKNTVKARLIVDFSSIPSFEKIISPTPKVFYRHINNENNTNDTGNFIDEEFTYKVLSPGCFYAERDNMKMDEAIRFEFSGIE